MEAIFTAAAPAGLLAGVTSIVLALIAVDLVRKAKKEANKAGIK